MTARDHYRDAGWRICRHCGASYHPTDHLSAPPYCRRICTEGATLTARELDLRMRARIMGRRK